MASGVMECSEPENDDLNPCPEEPQGKQEQREKEQDPAPSEQREEETFVIEDELDETEDNEAGEGNNGHGECGCSSAAYCCNTTEDHNIFLSNRNRKQNPELPKTVSVLEDPYNVADEEPGDMDPEDEGFVDVESGKVYLVGTAHFSKESQADVRKTISETQPDIVMVELCQSRVSILNMDEEALLKEAKNLSTESMLSTIKQSGLIQGIMHVLLLSMSAHITKQLGMAPGGEFRAAFQEAQNVPGCKFHLGDRPIQITLQRALASLNFWQKLRLFWYIVISHKTNISKEEVERCKQSDLLEELLREMAGEFPALSKIFVSERDQYMAQGLRSLLRKATALKSQQFREKGLQIYEPVVIVGVVGIGHKPGIETNWNKSVDIEELLRVPERSKRNVLFRYGLAGAIFGAVAYALFRGIKWGIGC